MELDLYVQDFTDLSIWNAICDSVQVDGQKYDHIVIQYNTAKGIDGDLTVFDTEENNNAG